MKQIAVVGLMAFTTVSMMACGSGTTSPDTGIDTGLADAGPTPVCDGKAEFDECAGGVCVKDFCNKNLTCFTRCGAIGEDCVGGTCYKINQDVYACMPAGKCVYECTPSDCKAPMQCLEVSGTKDCFMVCTVDTDCTATGTCVDTTFGFSVCVANETT